MMIHQIFVEKKCLTEPVVERLCKHFKLEPVEISSVDDYFGKVKKPYLQKRDSLQLFIGEKRGTVVKEAPAAYGAKGDPHYYFIHAYNCIYECQYCYLQGYFHSPDLVLFTNHGHILSEMQKVVELSPSAWFHAGEFSDSLALSHLTQEWADYFDFFRHHPLAKLELRTKSANVNYLKTLTPLQNVFISFTLSPEMPSKEIDLKAPHLAARLAVMNKLQHLGFKLAIHLDPMIYSANFKKEYDEFIMQLGTKLNLKEIAYISLGTVRFTKDVYRQVKENYPDSPIHNQQFLTSFDGKLRYTRPLRNWMMSYVHEQLINHNVEHDRIYWCME
jgi:spore photoproduct lyase